MRGLTALTYTLTYICVLLAGCSRSTEPTQPTEPTEPIQIEGAWAPAMPPNAVIGAVYMEITAHKPDRLLGASSPIAHSVEVHQTLIEEGIARMRPVEAIALGREPFIFEPGGAHFMLIGISTPLETGRTIELELQFEHAGTVTVQVPVMASDGDHAHH